MSWDVFGKIICDNIWQLLTPLNASNFILQSKTMFNASTGFEIKRRVLFPDIQMSFFLDSSLYVCLSIRPRLSNPEQPRGLSKGKLLRDPDFLTSFQSLNQGGALVSFYLTPRSAGLVGLEVEKWREEEEPRTMWTHNPLVPIPPGNRATREKDSFILLVVGEKILSQLF